jgi:serine/threonine protein kinase
LVALTHNPDRLALTPGTRLGVYEVTAQIGEGGMGQVFRAHDPRLNRDLALKILPDSFANDPDRLMRFTREAQTWQPSIIPTSHTFTASKNPAACARW